jgi:hypothetical protein
MKSAIFRTFLALAVLALFCMPVQAQDEETDGIAIVWQFSINDNQDDEFEEAVKGFHRFMADKEGAYHWDWYKVLTGPNTGKYIARSGNHDWADMDADHDWDDEADAYIDEHVSPHIDTATRMLFRTDHDLSNWPAENPGFKYFNLDVWNIKSGQGRKFNSGLKKIHELLVAGDFPVSYGFSYPVSGGVGGQIQLVTGHTSWADMAQPDPSFESILVEAMGEDEFASFMTDWGSTFDSGANWTVVHMKGMSHVDEDE